jgi:galactokinase
MMDMQLKETVLNAFRDKYGSDEGAKCFFAPGRVNLIGEHTDYNGGHVFPCALTLGTYCAARKRDDSLIRLYSVNFPDEGVLEDDIRKLVPLSDKTWASYVKGVVWAFEERGMMLPSGFDFVVAGDLPAGAGLSSSASLEVAAGAMIRELYGFDVSNVDLALIGQRAENEYNFHKICLLIKNIFYTQRDLYEGFTHEEFRESPRENTPLPLLMS